MSILRPCPSGLATALSNGAPLDIADLFVFTLQSGTVFRWTSYDYDLLVGGQTFSSRAPWLKRGKWNLVNTMEVPALGVTLMALNDNFDGGANIKSQIINGLFDGATFLLSRVYMPSPGDTADDWVIDIFGGYTAEISVTGTRADIAVKGGNNLLDIYSPINIYQIGCLHAFCDAGCTLNRATFTTSHHVGTGSGLSEYFIPWGSPPAEPGIYVGGTLTMTSGIADGQAQTIAAADSTGLTLIFPFYDTPAIGDAFTAFEGCDKTLDSGSGQSCTDRANTQNYRAFPFLPPPETTY